MIAVSTWRFTSAAYFVLSVVLSLLTAGSLTASAAERTVLFREDFTDLTQWKPFYFPKIERHTSYSVETNGSESYLKAVSHASASAMLWMGEFNVYQYPRGRWRWKVENVCLKGDARKKSGDDAPIRVFVLFHSSPGDRDFVESLKYEIGKAVYGEYPPSSSLIYIWANREHPERILPSPSLKKCKFILLEKGDLNRGKWVEHRVNILEDYEAAFGDKAPPMARIAVMNDSDNTGETLISYIDFIEVYGGK